MKEKKMSMHWKFVTIFYYISHSLLEINFKLFWNWKDIPDSNEEKTHAWKEEEEAAKKVVNHILCKYYVRSQISKVFYFDALLMTLNANLNGIFLSMSFVMKFQENDWKNWTPPVVNFFLSNGAQI